MATTSPCLCLRDECACDAPTQPRKPWLSGRDRDQAFKSAISKLRNARDEIARMVTEGQVELPEATLKQIDSSIGHMEEAHRNAAERYGFRMRPAIGPGDHEKIDQE